MCKTAVDVRACGFGTKQGVADWLDKRAGILSQGQVGFMQYIGADMFAGDYQWQTKRKYSRDPHKQIDWALS